MLDIFLVFGYLLLTLIFGVWIGKKVGSSEEYSSGGRNYSSWVIFATLTASFMGGGFTLGLVEKVFMYGLIYVLAIWGFSLKEILIGFFIAPKMQAFQEILTIGDIMERAYGKQAKIITGIASVLVCGGIIGAQIAACGSIIHTFLGPPPAIGALLAGGIVIIYSTLGGMKSIVALDILHFSVFTLILPLVLFFAIQEVGGVSSLLQAIPQSHLEFPGFIDVKTFIVLFVSFFLGETLIPPYVQRLLIGKTVKEIKQGTLWSGFFSVFFFFTVGCIGLVAFILAPRLPASSALPHVIQAVMPIGFKGLAIAAMLAVIMSSVDSFLNSIAITFSQDILLPLRLIAKNKNHELIIYRLITLTIGSVAIIISLSLSSSIDILLYSYQFWTPIILTPIVAAIFGIQSTDKAFLISSITGVLTVVFWNFISPDTLVVGALEGTILGVILNTIVFIFYHRFFNAKNTAVIISTSD